MGADGSGSTGLVKFLKRLGRGGLGRVINPQLADEQVRGGCVQGLGGALYEHCIYDRAGPTRERHDGSYLVPMAAEIPTSTWCTLRRRPSASLLGAKGVWESGTGAAPAVVMNAINDGCGPSGRV